MQITWFLTAMLTITTATFCFSQETGPVPDAEGYITHVDSSSNFDINGRHVIVKPDTRIGLRSERGLSVTTLDQSKPYIGESAKAYGKIDRKTHSVVATRIELVDLEPHEINGSGIIDAILSPLLNAAPADQLVRADGYPILLSIKTSTAYTQPLSATSPLTTNLWIAFHGVQRPDGIVVADTAKLTSNAISHGEDKLRTKHEYDPQAVDPNAHQGALSKALLGVDPKRIPPTTDAAMQARVNDIGQRLVPKFQRDLPGSEDTKIDFRFQVVDQPKESDHHALSNGIILVSHHLVERMQNDSQLAAILADNIATALEKQDLHAQPARRTMGGTEIAGAVGGIFIPGLSLATEAGNGIAEHKILVHQEEQSGRVSLGLLHDAGFDIQQAPIAWWILASKKDKDLAGTNIPRRAAYLYKMLGTTWHPQQP